MRISTMHRPPPIYPMEALREFYFIEGLANRHVIKYTPLEVVFRTTDHGHTLDVIYRGTTGTMKLIYEIAKIIFDFEAEVILGKKSENDSLVIMALERYLGKDHKRCPRFERNNYIRDLVKEAFQTVS